MIIGQQMYFSKYHLVSTDLRSKLITVRMFLGKFFFLPRPELFAVWLNMALLFRLVCVMLYG